MDVLGTSQEETEQESNYIAFVYVKQHQTLPKLVIGVWSFGTDVLNLLLKNDKDLNSIILFDTGTGDS